MLCAGGVRTRTRQNHSSAATDPWQNPRSQIFTDRKATIHAAPPGPAYTIKETKMAVSINQGVLAERESNRHVLRAVVASCIGWSLDLFDLFILLFVAPVIGRLFFPSDNPMWSLAAVYASFGVTLLMRPLGSALFGSFADVHGRKRAMIVSMVGVGVSTAHCSARCAWSRACSSAVWWRRPIRSAPNRWRPDGAARHRA
jgi:hypothetical protein